MFGGLRLPCWCLWILRPAIHPQNTRPREFGSGKSHPQPHAPSTTRHFVASPGSSKCNTLVIGGSMSGVEAASAIALNRSSSMLSANQISNNSNTKVHHIHSRSFGALPTYLPHGAAETPSFQPLDLAMYDLSRRPPGFIEYALGPHPRG